MGDQNALDRQVEQWAQPGDEAGPRDPAGQVAEPRFGAEPEATARRPHDPVPGYERAAVRDPEHRLPAAANRERLNARRKPLPGSWARRRVAAREAVPASPVP